jgi:hypothetical protein
LNLLNPLKNPLKQKKILLLKNYYLCGHRTKKSCKNKKTQESVEESHNTIRDGLIKMQNGIEERKQIIVSQKSNQNSERNRSYNLRISSPLMINRQKVIKTDIEKENQEETPII